VIVLIGFMGAGKTTVGTLLAARLDLPFTDSDHAIEQKAGRPIRQIFAEDGEPAFRALEHEVIADLLDGPPTVLALGGGAPGHPPTRALLAPRGLPFSSGGTHPPGPPLGIPSLLGGSLPPHTPAAPRTPLEVVYLHVGYEQALDRVGGGADPGSRPLLARPDLPGLYRSRLPVYAAVATLTVPTDGRPPGAICEDLLARLERASGYSPSY
jgi:shikimate kinase